MSAISKISERQTDTHTDRQTTDYCNPRACALRVNNVATIIDDRGVSLKFSSRQRAFESKLCRYQRVLKKEKIAAGIETLRQNYPSSAIACSLDCTSALVQWSHWKHIGKRPLAIPAQ